MITTPVIRILREAHPRRIDGSLDSIVVTASRTVRGLSVSMFRRFSMMDWRSSRWDTRMGPLRTVVAVLTEEINAKLPPPAPRPHRTWPVVVKIHRHPAEGIPWGGPHYFAWRNGGEITVRRRYLATPWSGMAVASYTLRVGPEVLDSRWHLRSAVQCACDRLDKGIIREISK